MRFHFKENNMPEFTYSWAFAFIVGCFVGGLIGFVLTIICAASGKASRVEEKIEQDLLKEINR